MSCKLSPVETICRKCQILLSVKKMKNIFYFSSVELAQRVVKVNTGLTVMGTLASKMTAMIKRKSAFKHAQNVQNYIILCMCSLIKAFALHSCFQYSSQ